MFWTRFFKRQEVMPGQVWRSGFNGKLTRVDDIEVDEFGRETVNTSVYIPVGHWARSERSDGWMTNGRRYLIEDRACFMWQMRRQRAVLVATDGHHPDGEDKADFKPIRSQP